MRHVALIFPRFKLPSGDPPLGIAYVASYARRMLNIDISIFDATFNPSFDLLRRYFKEKKPDIAGIYVDTMMFNDAVRAAGIARSLGIFTVAGGPHASIMPETLVDAVDAVVVGEGEETFKELIEQYTQADLKHIQGIVYKKNGETTTTPRRLLVEDLDTLGFPALDLLDMDNYIRRWHYLDAHNIGIRGTNIMSSRGCPFHCSYCQPTLRKIFGEKIRFRTITHVVEEIVHLKKTYDVNGIFFHDDTFTLHKKWLEGFCDTLNEEGLRLYWGSNTRSDTLNEPMMRKMYAVGLRSLHIGAESGSQRILGLIYKKGITLGQIRNLVKKAKSIGIHCFCFFMLGAPTETHREIWKTIAFACSLPIDEASFSLTTPLPMTHLYDLIKNDEKYFVSSNYSDFNYYSKRAYRDPGIPNWALKWYHMIALIAFYTTLPRWNYVLKHLASINGIKKMVRKIWRNV